MVIFLKILKTGALNDIIIEGLIKKILSLVRPYGFAGVCQLSQDFRIVKKSDKLGKMRSAPVKSIF